MSIITPANIKQYHNDGATCVRNVFSQQWLDVIARGVERNLQSPSQYASENAVGEGSGRFFDDYVNWQRIPEYENVIRQSPAAKSAAELMQSASAQFFHDHLLVKEPNTTKETPWHQDAPYYFVEGKQTISMWIPLEPVGKNKNTLRFIAGSHLWKDMVRPVSWADDSDFYDRTNQNTNINSAMKWAPIPDPDGRDQETMKVLEWSLQPGDVVFFHFRTCHGARGNSTRLRRRALSLRWVGDDARYIERPGTTSPPFPGHGMIQGEKLREDWFPVLYNSNGSRSVHRSNSSSSSGSRSSSSSKSSTCSRL